MIGTTTSIACAGASRRAVPSTGQANASLYSVIKYLRANPGTPDF